MSSPKINCLQALDLFRFEIYVPVAAINNRKVKAAITNMADLKDRSQLRFDVYKNLGQQNFQKQGPLLGYFFLLWQTHDQCFPGSHLFRSLGHEEERPWERGFDPTLVNCPEKVRIRKPKLNSKHLTLGARRLSPEKPGAQ